jgi:hypothetical protein
VHRDLANATKAIVEVTFDLKRERPVVERLRQLAEGDLAAADERCLEARPGWRTSQLPMCSQSSTGDFSYHFRVCGRAVIPLSLKLPDSSNPRTEAEASRLHLHLLNEQVGGLQNGSPFADGDDLASLR